MPEFSPWSQFQHFLERESMRPDLARAVRGTLSFAVPLVLSNLGWLPFNLTFVVFAAHSIALVDVRGAYTFRLALLLTMTAILAGASILGGGISTSLIAAILGTCLIATFGGIWRHFAPDYGPALAISSTLLFLLAVNTPVDVATAQQYAIGAAVGGLWGVFLQVANWPIRPQHPLRRAASDSWVAVADLFAALLAQSDPARNEHVRQAEAALRTTLDQTYAALAAARATPVRLQLEELNLVAARIATRVVALNTALEDLLTTPAGTSFSASLQPLLTSLTNTSRSVAVTVVSHQPAHLAVCEVRVQRLGHLLRAVIEGIPKELRLTHAAGQLQAMLQQIEQTLPHLLTTLRATVDRAGERAAFSLELRDLDTWTLRPLASAINLSRRVDPALVRFTARLSVLTMVGVAIAKYGSLSHGYWLPLTTVIVLQPDYGSTRQRAAQRVLGTLAGSLFASMLLWLHLPTWGLTATTALTIFCFGFFLKRQYAIAVFFITLAVVVLTEAHGPVSVAFTLERFASTLSGGALALLGALFFWPVWERDRLPKTVAAAVTANRDFLRLIATRLAEGGGYDARVIAAKRHAEAANSAVFSSLQRMMGDPQNRRAGLEQIAACANGNQRVTRALIPLALQLSAGVRLETPRSREAFEQLDRALEHLQQMLERTASSSAELELAHATVAIAVPPREVPADGGALREHGLLTQLARIATELNAMQFSATPDSGLATISDVTAAPN